MSKKPFKLQHVIYTETKGLPSLFASVLEMLEVRTPDPIDITIGEEGRLERAFGRTKNGGFPVLWDLSRKEHLETCERACMHRHCPTCGTKLGLGPMSSIYCTNH